MCELPVHPSNYFHAIRVKMAVEVERVEGKVAVLRVGLKDAAGEWLVLWSTTVLRAGESAELVDLYAIPGLSSIPLDVLALSCFDPDTLELKLPQTKTR